MIPYADFLYFGILLYIAVPTLLIRRWLGFSRTWVLLATAAMLVVQYATIVHLLPVIRFRGSLARHRVPCLEQALGGPRALGGTDLRPVSVGRGPCVPQDPGPALPGTGPSPRRLF